MNDQLRKTGFTGIWFPRWIWELEDISLTEKTILAIVRSITEDQKLECFWSNKGFAKILDCSEGTVANILSMLWKVKLLRIEGKFNTRRLQLHEIMKLTSQNNEHISEKDNINTVSSGNTADEVTALKKTVEEAFLSVVQWTNWPKERAAIKRILQIAEASKNGMETKTIIQLWMTTFLSLIHGNQSGMDNRDKRFWGKFAFTPSKMGSMLDDLNVVIKKHEDTLSPELQEWIISHEQWKNGQPRKFSPRH